MANPIQNNRTVIGMTHEGNVGLQLVDMEAETTASLLMPPAEAAAMAMRLIQAAYGAQLRRVLETKPIGPETMNAILQEMAHDLDGTFELPRTDNQDKPYAIK